MLCGTVSISLQQDGSLQFEGIHALIHILVLVKQGNKHCPDLFRCRFGKTYNHASREIVDGSQQIEGFIEGTSQHFRKILSVHVPIVLNPFDSFPFVFFVAPLRGDKILLVVRQYIFQSKLVKHDATPLCLSQAFINLVCKDTKDLSLDLIVAEKKRKEILVLLQALNQCIVNVIKIRKFKIFNSIVPCAGFQLVGFQQNIPNLQHSFDRNIVVVGFSRL